MSICVLTNVFNILTTILSFHLPSAVNRVSIFYDREVMKSQSKGDDDIEFSME